MGLSVYQRLWLPQLLSPVSCGKSSNLEFGGSRSLSDVSYHIFHASFQTNAYYSLLEEGSAMDIDNNQPLTTPVSHQCVLNTLGALCMDESIIHEVIPRLIEHVQRLCNGECLEKDILPACHIE